MSDSIKRSDKETYWAFLREYVYLKEGIIIFIENLTIICQLYCYYL